MDNSTRHICCKCGRKRHKTALIKNTRFGVFNYSYRSNWKNYPQINSYLCKKECLPYSQDVHFTSVKK